MSAESIESSFPSLSASGYQIESPEDFNYNCLAFVLGDRNNWWEPLPQFVFYWPSGFSPDVSVATVVKIIQLHGYIVECDRRANPLSDAIAVYAKNEEWTHLR